MQLQLKIKMKHAASALSTSTNAVHLLCRLEKELGSRSAHQEIVLGL